MRPWTCPRRRRCSRPIGRSVSGAVGAEMIEALPNITQNPLAYAYLQAGALPRRGQRHPEPQLVRHRRGRRRQFSAVGINGGRAFTNDIQLDGLPVMGGGYNEASVVPNTEGLQEVGHLQQLQRRMRARPSRDLDEHEVGHERLHGQGVT